MITRRALLQTGAATLAGAAAYPLFAAEQSAGDQAATGLPGPTPAQLTCGGYDTGAELFGEKIDLKN